MTLTFGSFCSGIGAPESAWLPLGWVPKFFAEIETFPSSVLAHHYPDVPNVGDMTKVDTAGLPDVDLWVAGTPCQAFSVAGLRKSLGDDRGNLTLTFCRMVHERDPAVVVWENVPGVLNTKDNAFGCFLAGLVGEGEPLVCGQQGWRDAGMAIGPRRSAAWRVLDAQYVGLAQRRRRVFVVSFRTGDGINPGAVLFEPESLPRHSPPGREAGAGVAGTFAPRTHGGGGLGTDFECDGGLMPATAHSLLAKGNDSHASDLDTYIPTTTHTLRADGFDASEDGTGRGTPLVPVFGLELDNQGGGGNVGFHGDERPFKTLNTSCPPGAAYPIPFDTTQLTSASNYSNPKPGDPCHPLASGGHAPAVAYSIHADAVERSGEANTPSSDATGKSRLRPPGIGISEDASFALTTGKPHAVAFQERGRPGGRTVESQIDLAYSLCSPKGGGRSQENKVATPTMAVRRLTPTECERLQGFRDGFTAIAYRGKPAADGPRYRALGNSMAVPVVRWIGERIAKVINDKGLPQ